MEGEGEVTRESTRIYVGGLGGGVTEDDLRKTFSALGEVVSVDVVRTKGRSFAYLDFLPSSDKSLPKLFSTYNGCMWKGGKLRLEKAKEHFLVKLKREWQEESQLATKTTDKSQNHDTLEKTKKPSSEINKQLCLFFPKLGKVKSLGQVGIGKHKYSFQRIEVPPIPTHFCDCEEHSLPFIPNKKNKISEFENASDGINEQELNIMNSVMNKIFERANPSKQVVDKSKSAVIENSEEDHLTDEDNLIINVGTGNDGVDLLAEMRRSMMVNRDAVANNNMHNGGKKKTLRANRVLINNEKSELVNDKSNNIENRNEDHVTDEDNLIINVANGSDDVDLLAEMRMMTNQDAVAKMPPVKKRKSPNSQEKHINDTRKKRKIEVKSDTKQPGNNSLRSLKSTWKDLIGRKCNTPFTISNIISTVDQEKHDKSNGDDDTELYNIQNQKEHGTDVDMKTVNESDIHQSDPPEKHAGDLNRAARGGSRRQKSSWTRLIGQTSFSISQIVPDLSFENHEPVNG
ncbi:hypothetical protein L2E82_03625 [Cichorium intybus]|uniref:Uncharacterized protein n=1 Tax=Cichorium intybus TaxID=13427 RepID=A0ACB9H5A1_CICIN|nr:hypothetical protein L2E82_03625 [Cichorium intybus]